MPRILGERRGAFTLRGCVSPRSLWCRRGSVRIPNILYYSISYYHTIIMITHIKHIPWHARSYKMSRYLPILVATATYHLIMHRKPNGRGGYYDTIYYNINGCISVCVYMYAYVCIYIYIYIYIYIHMFIQLPFIYLVRIGTSVWIPLRASGPQPLRRPTYYAMYTYIYMICVYIYIYIYIHIHIYIYMYREREIYIVSLSLSIYIYICSILWYRLL